MTDFLRQAWTVVRNPWALLGLAVLAAVLLAWRLNVGRAELAALRREHAETELRAKGLLVAAGEREKDLEQRLKGLSGELQDAVARAETLGRGVRVVEIVRARTVESAAAGAPREAGEGARGPGATTGPASPGEPPAPACLLAVGDLGQVEVDEARLETKEGARIVVGEAWAWRTAPGRARLFGGPFDAKVSEAAATPSQAAAGGPGWGGGVWVAAGSGGAVAGPAVALPPVFGLEATAGVGLGSGGAWAGGLSVVWRP